LTDYGGLEFVRGFDSVQRLIKIRAAVALIFFPVRRPARQRYRSAAIGAGYAVRPVLLVYLRAMLTVSLLRHDFLVKGLLHKVY
jgi:hypothetical protein